MAKIFEVDFRTGSAIDKVSGTVPTITGNPSIRKSEDGLSAYLSTGNSYSYGNLFTLAGLNSSFTFVFSYKSNQTTAANLGLTKGTQFLFNFGGVIANRLSFLVYDGAGAQRVQTNINTNDNNFHHIVCVGNAGNLTMYVDGILQTITDTYATIVTDSSNVVLTAAKADCLTIQVYNHALTDIERAKTYRDFLNSYPKDKPVFDYQALKPTDLSREKENTVAQDLLGGINFLDAAWNKAAGLTITSSTSYSTLAGTDFIRRNDVTCAVGKRYRIEYSLTITAGQTFSVRDYSATAGSAMIQLIGTGALQTGSLDFTVTSWTSTGVAFYGVSGSVSITYFRIREITGLVAAYNFIPNGNTLVDISGNGYTLTTKRLVSSGSGISFPGIGIGISGASSSNFYNPASSPFSISCRIRPNTTTQNINICRKSTSYTNGFTVSLGSFSTRYQFTVYLNSVGFTTTGYYIQPYADNNITINVNTVVGGTTDIDFYVGGVFVERVSKIGVTTISNADTFSIGDYAHGGWTAFKGEIEDFRIYNRILSLQEIKNYHNQFAKQISLREDFSTNGADGVSKVPQGWSKQSGAFKIGEHVAKTGNLSSFDIAAVSQGWGKVGSTFLYTASIANSYITYSNVLTIGKRYKLRFRCVDNPNDTTLVVYNNNFAYLSPSVGFIPVAGEYYEYQASAILADDVALRVSAGGVGGLILDNVETTEIQPLPTFKQGTKYLECVTAGTLAIPSKQAYGTWEFDWYKAADANGVSVTLINSKTTVYPNALNSYIFSATALESARVVKTSGASATELIASASSYFANNTWYRVKITRSLAGVFTLLIKGGSFAPTDGYNGWTLVPVTSGIGTNPATDTAYTSSEYSLISLSAGDRIANIEFKEGIEV